MTSAEELSVQPRGEAAAHSADSSSAAGISDDMVRLPVSASNYVPSRIERWLQSVVMDKHGRMLLTASNLTGRFWDAPQCCRETYVSKLLDSIKN